MKEANSSADPTNRSLPHDLGCAGPVATVAYLEFSYEAGLAVAAHAHPRGFFSFTLAGEFVERRGARRHSYGPGSASFHPPHEEHAIYIAAPTRCVSFELGPEWLEHAAEVAPRPLRHRTAAGGPISWLCARLRRELVSGCATPLAVEALTLELLAEAAATPGPADDRHPPPWLLRIGEELRGEPGQALSVRALARRAGVHPVHLARTWRRFHRCTLAESLWRLRIDRACRLLAGPAPPLAELADELGFADQAHFCRVFRRITGTSPGRYRDAFRPLRPRSLG